MGELFDGWTRWVEDAYMLLTPEEKDYIRAKYITKNEEDEPKLTTEQEIDLMNEQIDASEGFDIDFSLFRCLFNYHPLDFDDDDFAEPPETNGDLVKRLSEQSLDIYNQENRTEYEFVKVLYANFHGSSGIMFLITFQVKDPVDNLTKEFQARVRYTFVSNTDFVFCRPKPNQEVLTDKDDDGAAEKDFKKPRFGGQTFLYACTSSENREMNHVFLNHHRQQTRTSFLGFDNIFL